MIIDRARLKWCEILTIFSLITIFTHLILELFIDSSSKIFAISNIPLLLIVVVGGGPLILKIFAKALKGDLGSDMLAAIALITAIFLQQFLAADLIVLMLASGEALENYAEKKASFALAALAKRMPSVAHKKILDKIIDIKIEEIVIGDLVVIYPFETSPVDGEVVDGYGNMDESYLTGEPYSLSKAPGSMVISGAINGENLLVVRAEKLAIDSRYSKIMEVMADAESKKPKLRRLGDQIGAIFAPIALLFAGMTWYLSGDITRFLSVLVVATPCPLLIAIPIAIVSAISVAAKNGIIIKAM